MSFRVPIKWLALCLLALPVAAFALLAIFGWNWARGPLERLVHEKTGRVLVIGGDLDVSLAWPAPRVHANAVRFANPSWAMEKQMIAVDRADFSVDLVALMRRRLVFPEVRLVRPVVFLEQAADGRKTWLLDIDQTDDAARIPVGRLTLDEGKLGYDDAAQKTRIRAEVSTVAAKPDGTASDGVEFRASGLYKGLALTARGNGASVLGLHDETLPYPLKVDATIGHSSIKAEGSITSLVKFTAMDMQLVLKGDSLALLYPLTGLAFPETGPYVSDGRLVHRGPMWRYEKFAGHVGKSDLGGTLQVDTGGARAFMHGDLASRMLDLDDLAPVIGVSKSQVAQRKAALARSDAAAAKSAAPAPKTAAARGPRVLPEIPFKAERWDGIDADVSLRAGSIAHAVAVPLENLVAHLRIKDAVLTLDPLDFGFAGGHLKSMISLDGRAHPIRAKARIAARKVHLARLFPAVKLTQGSIGEINGDIDLAGSGESVGRMLASADGRVAMVIGSGEISRLLMEQIGLHLIEILQLKLTGDQPVRLRCGVADFGVKSGVMETRVLVLDTDVSTITGSGRIDLKEERLDLTLMPKTRNLSPVALRSPIHVTGNLARPEVDIDKGRIAARGIGALALGLINPLLALLPLIETGPGVDSDCARLIQAARTPVAPAPRARIAAK